MKVWVDEDRCRGHGMCLTLCPEVFNMHDDGYAVADPDEALNQYGRRIRSQDGLASIADRLGSGSAT